MSDELFFIDTTGEDKDYNSIIHNSEDEAKSNNFSRIDNELFFIDTGGDGQSLTNIEEKPKDKGNLRQDSQIIYAHDTENDVPLGSDAADYEAKKDSAPRLKRPTFPRHMNKRYHETENLNSRFKPGVISPALSEALGLSPNQLPLHVYRMRCLGYPPGWLKKVEVAKGELSIIERDGSLDENCKQVSYNFDQLISYPGFNVPCPPNCVDQWSELGAYPMQDFQLLENFKRFLQTNGYMPTQDPGHSESRFLMSHTNSTNDNSCDESLDDLEKERRRLILELSKTDSTCNEESNNEETRPDSAESTDKSEPISADNQTSTVTEELGFGSPVLHSVTTPLPSLEKWSLGVSDYRPFENLPNSEGRYDILNETIRKRRESLRKSVSLSEVKNSSCNTLPSSSEVSTREHYPTTPHQQQHQEGRSFRNHYKHSSHYNRYNHSKSSPYSRSHSHHDYHRY